MVFFILLCVEGALHCFTPNLGWLRKKARCQGFKLMSWFNIDVWWILNKISPLAAAAGLDESFPPHYGQIRWKQSWGGIPYSGRACRVSAALLSNFLLSLLSLLKIFFCVAIWKILGSKKSLLESVEKPRVYCKNSVLAIWKVPNILPVAEMNTC